ncbi:hypothetical protein D9619_004630 [Psilocybe cf. subviscida]|uniref:Uncharacterized protein n=1 Tax=Psilocybe cf. subviscida TaxID=2480587 RepID=A0A8H5F8N8_9AGAR|nr:hypothetical protein D9619_004630 [Psilocybe cf. subviscida]
MLRQMPHVSQMDANGSQVRIFQERTNFKNLQGHSRFDWCIEGSIPKTGATQQENSFTDLPRRRKSERKMLRSNANMWPGPVDAVMPTQEHGPTVEEESLHGSAEPFQGPIFRQPRAYSKPSERVRADSSLLLMHSSETETEADHKLKLAALTRVTSSLAAKASDAKQGVERLRKLLADRAVEPSIYEATQRERWMEERRQVATEELLKTVRDHLSSLVKSPASSLSQPTPTIEHDEEVSSTAANLHIFLTSPHRPAPRSSRKRRPYPAPLPEDAFNRIRHHKQLLPLRLKVPVHRPFSQPPPKAKQVSAKGTETLPPGAIISTSAEPAITNTTSPTSLSNDTLHLLPSLAPPLDAIPENREDTPTPSLERPPSPGNGSGMATIWRAVPLRSKEEILAGLASTDDVDMPDYVQNLLAKLDSTPISHVRLNSIRKSASFPRRPASPAAAVRSSQRNSHANANSNTKRDSTASIPAAPNPPSVLAHSTNVPSPIPPFTNNSTNASSHIQSSPSRRRISALFSLPEVLSSRRSLNFVHTHSPPMSDTSSLSTASASSAAQLPAMSLVSPSIGFTIMESSREGEEEAEEGDLNVDRNSESNGQSRDGHEHAPEPQAPIPPSTSAITLSSVGTIRDVRRSSAGVSTSNTEDKMLARLRRRMSAALGRQ